MKEKMNEFREFYKKMIDHFISLEPEIQLFIKKKHNKTLKKR